MAVEGDRSADFLGVWVSVFLLGFLGECGGKMWCFCGQYVEKCAVGLVGGLSLFGV